MNSQKQSITSAVYQKTTFSSTLSPFVQLPVNQTENSGKVFTSTPKLASNCHDNLEESNRQEATTILKNLLCGLITTKQMTQDHISTLKEVIQVKELQVLDRKTTEAVSIVDLQDQKSLNSSAEI